MPESSGLLINESPLQVSPTLAKYIGLNEALFLQQLHFILTRNSKVGKEADGRKWYRDKPIAFIEKYFPFWDESTIKRAMDNLRDDNLLLTRSDLNTRPKDRSLWYSINYQALNLLDSPVARITDKSQKRRMARQSRPEKEQCTEVQNVLLIDNDEVTKVQNVPQSKVQNVPTPKDSLPKDSLPNPNGLGPTVPKTPNGKAKVHPDFIPAFKVYIDITNHYGVTQHWRKKMGDTVGLSPPDLTFWGEVVEGYTGCGWFKGNVQSMLEYYERREIPSTSKNGHKNGVNGTNGTHHKNNGSGHTQATNADPNRIPSVNIYDDD